MEENTNIKLPADRQNLNRFIDFITDFAKKGGFHDKGIWELELAADEIFTNIINYAYPQQKGNIEVNCSFDNQRLLIEIYDHGIPFNPLSYPNPEIIPDIQEIRTEGNGIFLVRRLMDNIVYRREGNRTEQNRTERSGFSTR